MYKKNIVIIFYVMFVVMCKTQVCFASGTPADNGAKVRNLTVEQRIALNTAKKADDPAQFFLMLQQKSYLNAAVKEKNSWINKAANTLRNNDKTKRAWGIASSAVEMGFKIRSSVRYCYDEVKFWYGLVEDYKMLKRYMNNVGGFIEGFGKDVGNLFTEHGNFVSKLENIVSIYDKADVIIDVPNRLDQRFLEIESDWDKFVGHETYTFTLGPWQCNLEWTPGFLVPDSKEFFEEYANEIWNIEFLENFERFNNKLINYANGNGWVYGPTTLPGSPTLPDADGFDAEGNVLYQLDDIAYTDLLSYYRLPIMSSFLVGANAQAISFEYNKWWQKAYEAEQKNMEALFKVLGIDTSKSVPKDTAGINAMAFAALWYTVVTVNSNNKLLRHQIEESKILQAIVGTDLHVRSDVRADELRIIAGQSKFNGMRDLEVLRQNVNDW